MAEQIAGQSKQLKSYPADSPVLQEYKRQHVESSYKAFEGHNRDRKIVANMNEVDVDSQLLSQHIFTK